MYPHWYSMQSNEKQIHDMPRQSTNQGAFRFQPNYPYMWQQQQQQQGQFMFQNFPPFPPFPPFPNNVNTDVQNRNYGQPNTNYMYTENNNNNSSGQHRSQNFRFEGEEGNNKISYQRNPNQEQYASYPRDAIHRHASGPGWQKQEVFYPAKSFK